VLRRGTHARRRAVYGAMFHCWQVLPRPVHWRTTVPFAVPQFVTTPVGPARQGSGARAGVSANNDYPVR